MNAVLDVLKLRRVKLDYISPPVCPGLAVTSSSGSSIFVEANDGPDIPVGRLGGQCDAFLLWNDILDLVCISLYQAQDLNNQESPYALVSECLPALTAQVCSPGWWIVTTTDRFGVEGAQSDAVLCTGAMPARITIPKNAGDKSFSLYKNPDPANATGNFSRVLNSTTFGAFELCESTGCYRLQSITDDGASSLSNSVCRSEAVGCCPPEPCSSGLVWDDSICSCVSGPMVEIVASLGPICAGVGYLGTFTAVGSPGPTTWAITGGVIPSGLIFNGGTLLGNTTTISGITATSGAFTFTVRATPAGGKYKEENFTITSMKVDALPVASTDVAYSQQVGVTGGTPPYSFSIISGSLPTGLTISASGLISGTARDAAPSPVVIQVQDSVGIKCDTSMTVSGCPTGPAHPTIASWSQPASVNYGALDRVRRNWWVLTDVYHPTPPYAPPLAIFDTASKAFVGYATDSLGLVSTANLGDTSNNVGTVFIDTKYQTAVVCGQIGNVIWYGLDSKNVVQANSVGIGFAQVNPRGDTAYDSARGVAYLPTTTLGTVLVRVLDCNPGIRTITATYTGAGYVGGDNAYSPLNDTVYLANTNGPNLFHTWNPTSHAFTYNQGPAGTARALRHVRGLNLIMIWSASSGHAIFIDPAQGNAVVGDVAWSGASAGFVWVDYNDCSGLIYASVSGEDHVYSFNPQTGFSVTTLGTSQYRLFAFDPLANVVFARDAATGNIVTF